MKQLIIVLALAVAAGHTQAQNSLKITREKIEYWRNGTWTGWPDSYSYFTKGQEPVIEITSLDEDGYRFQIRTWINGSYSSFYVTYKTYDASSDWYKYVDESGDEICTRGARLSFLARNGWPSNNLTQIYLWAYSKSLAVVME